MNGTTHFAGSLKTKKIRAKGPGLLWQLSNYLRWNFILGWLAAYIVAPVARLFGLAVMFGKLEAVLIRANGERVRYGVLGYRSVTTAFVSFVVDQLQTELSIFGDFKYHDSGVGVTAENIANTDMETTDGESRATGTQAEASATVYQSVGTISYTTTKAITEHGLFNAATSVTLMDRTVFSAINVVSGDSIQFTYSLTCAAGG
jgi:hypothetical protein